MSTLDLDPDSDALLVVDLQPDFMPGGALPVADGDRIAAPIAALTARFATVVATQDWHPRGHVSFAARHGREPFSRIALYGAEHTLWPEHCVAGTPGAALHPALPDERITMILRKGTHRDVDSYSAFRENRGPDGRRPATGLAAWLRDRGISRLFVCGLARDVCVADTAVDGVDEGFAVWVVDDLTRAVDPTARASVDRRLVGNGVRIIDSASLSGAGLS